MQAKTEAKILRIYLSNTDKFKHNLLYETFVFAARRYGLAGATVFKGVMGYGAGSAINSAKFWEITEKLPVVIEIIDEAEKIDNFFVKIQPCFDKVRKGCLVCVEKADVLICKTDKKNS